MVKPSFCSPSSGFSVLGVLFFLLSCDSITVDKHTRTLGPSQSVSTLKLSQPPHNHLPQWIGLDFLFATMKVNWIFRQHFHFQQNHHIWSWKATAKTKRNHIKSEFTNNNNNARKKLVRVWMNRCVFILWEIPTQLYFTLLMMPVLAFAGMSLIYIL